ncbi:MAG: Maf family protein, partial [Burkholderiales bacterium]|nr:Maf family protein [Burkholderiales bacterium]
MAGNSSIYLASRSPRRRELLNQIGVAHEVLTRRITAER